MSDEMHKQDDNDNRNKNESQKENENGSIFDDQLDFSGRVKATMGSDSAGLGSTSDTKNIFSDEDGSLMELYESRLRRLREYETKVYSRYSAPTIQASTSKEDPSQTKNDHAEALATPFKVSKEGIESNSDKERAYPQVIDLKDDEGLDDDITFSTGINSNILVDSPLPRNAERREIIEDEEINEMAEQESAPDFPTDNSYGNLATEYSSGSSNKSPVKKTHENDNPKRETSDLTEAIGEGFGYSGAADSKYGRYSVLVNSDQEDRAVEIILYSAARPHMRAFHFAWMAFFIAFFTWFAITPLLSEVAISLNLGREEIWTSSTLAVAGSAVTRIMIGPINDIYGARWTMFGTLIFSAIPSGIAGLVIHNASSLYIIRLLIGVAGSAFVTCQFWTTTMFTPEVAGTANSLAAGWGNLGGGVAQIVMGSLLFPLLKVLYGGEGYGSANTVYGKGDDAMSPEYDRAADLAWRTALVFPAVLCVIIAYMCIKYGDDCPKGNFRKRKVLGLMPIESTKDALRRGCSNLNTWLLFLQYGCCFGVEITMTNAAALYFQEEFDQNTETAAAIASIFGWMNLFARGIGGFVSDMSGANHGMRGRLWCQTLTLMIEGALVLLFAVTETLASAILIMALFSILVQAAEGSTFAIVPYVDYAVTGSIAGIVGAGGNVGGVIFSIFFREFDNRGAIKLMGAVALGSSLLSGLIAIPGHRSLLRGTDAPEVLLRRDAHNEQVGSRPNVDLHLHSGDAPQSILRADGFGFTPETHVDSSDPSVESGHI